MKKIYILIIIVLSFEKGFSQSCISLGCAANYGTITVDGTLPDVPGDPLGASCYGAFSTYKQIWWQFFYSPAGGNFSHVYTPVIDGGGTLDLDYIVYDMGISLGAGAISCPVDPTSWTEMVCNNLGTDDAPIGPGALGCGCTEITTTAGHYYAIAIISWQGPTNGGDASYSFTIGTPQLAGGNLTAANCPGVLPVRLSSFNAKINNCVVDLDWASESGSDFKNYEVQYSTNGTRFETIASVAGAQQGSNKKYTYQDAKPMQGNVFYRLKTEDINGKFEYSKIIVLNLACNRSSLIIYPNPVTDILNVNITNLRDQLTTARLFDNNGKLIYSGKMISGSNTIDMTKFAKGVYLLRLKNNVETHNIKIIK